MAYIELLGAEHELDEKRQKRDEARAKRREEMAKQLEEMQTLDGAMADLQDAKNGMPADGMNQVGDDLNSLGMMNPNRRPGQGRTGRGRGQGDRPEAPDDTATYTANDPPNLTGVVAAVT